MGGANEVLEGVSPGVVDRVLDLVVNALRLDEVLLQAAGGADKIGAYSPYPPPDLTPTPPLLMVSPISSTEVPAPGLVLATIDLQIVYRFALYEAQQKARGKASYATVPERVRRVLTNRGLLEVNVPGIGPVPLAKESHALAGPMATIVGGAAGGPIYDASQGWHYVINLKYDSGQPWNLAAAGG